MAFIKSLLIASVATLAVAAPGYEYGTAPAKAVQEPAYAAPSPAVVEPAYVAPKPAVVESAAYSAPAKAAPAVKEPEYTVTKPAVKEDSYSAPKPAVVEPAMAAPAPAPATEEVDVSSQNNNPVCGNGQQLSCCNSGEDLIGANCLSVPILAVPVQQACGSNVAACCQTGNALGNLLNLELNCLALPL